VLHKRRRLGIAVFAVTAMVMISSAWSTTPLFQRRRIPEPGVCRARRRRACRISQRHA